MRVIEAHRGPVLAVAYLPGQRLVSAGWDGTVATWDVPRCEEQTRIRLAHRAHWLAVTADGKRLALGSPAALDLLDVPTEKFTPVAEGSGPLAWGPGGRVLASGNAVWSLPNLRASELPGVGQPLAVSWTPTGELIVLLESQVKVFNVALSEQLFRRLPRFQGLVGTIDPVGHWVCLGNRQGRLFVVSVRDGGIQELPGHAAQILGCAFSQDGRLLATACVQGVVRLWDTSDWSERQCFDWGISSIRGLAIAPDGMTAVAAGFDGTLLIWDLE